VATSNEEGGAGTKRDHTPKSRGLGIEHQSCVRGSSRTRDVIRASHVQGRGITPLQPRSRTDRLRAILISWCHSVFIPAEIRLRSSEPDHRTECEGAWALGLSRALLNPVTFLLDLLAVGRLVRSALLRHRRLLQAVEDRGLEALQNVA